MFDNLFTSSPSAWTGLIAGAVLLPILIHLINLVRYKKVPFAAMDFLLKSQKQSRNYIWLKQLLLLLCRIAALLLALFLTAQVGCQQDRIARILGGRSTHHYVLLDDSFSMTDVGSEGSNISAGAANLNAFDRAQSVLTAIAGRVSNRQNQKFSLLRFSAGDPLRPVEMPLHFDVENQLVDSNFNRLLDETRGQLKPSNLSLSPAPAIERLSALIEDRTDENPILYVLSDFRSKDWEQLDALNEDLAKIKNANGAIELVNCVTSASRNLAVVDLQPVAHVRVVSTPLMMEVAIKNFSDSPMSKVRASIVTHALSQPSSPSGVIYKTEDLPSIFIDNIEANATVRRQFPVLFLTPGEHVVSVELESDAIAVDNRRSCVVPIKESSKVLLVDDANQRHSSFLKLALNPNNLTGIEPSTEPKDFLRDTNAEQLDDYDVVFLLDVASLDDVAVKNLEAYCDRGGGVAFFLGPKADISFCNRLFEQSPQLFPIELDQTIEIEEDPQSQVADFLPSTHPIFAPVLDQKTSLLDWVEIANVIAPTRQWLLAPPTTARIIATVRGNEDLPLMVESSVGKGRVMVCTTTAGPVWNNWAKNATYLPILLLMQDYLAGGKWQPDELTLSSPLVIRKSAKEFLPNVTVVAGAGDELNERDSVNFKMSSSDDNAEWNLRLPTILDSGRANLNSTGVIDFWFQELSGGMVSERVAINADTNESRLQTVDSARLLVGLKQARPTWVDWNQFNPEPELRPASALSRLCLALLVCVFALEPFLAYLVSFHHK